MYEMVVTEEFIEFFKTIPSEYLVVLISQINSIKNLKGDK